MLTDHFHWTGGGRARVIPAEKCTECGGCAHRKADGWTCTLCGAQCFKHGARETTRRPVMFLARQVAIPTASGHVTVWEKLPCGEHAPKFTIL